MQTVYSIDLQVTSVASLMIELWLYSYPSITELTYIQKIKNKIACDAIKYMKYKVISETYVVFLFLKSADTYLLCEI